MNLILRALAAVVLTALCFILTNMEEGSKYSPVNLDRNTTVQGVIANNYSEYTAIRDTQVKAVKKEKVKIDKQKDKQSVDYLGSIEIPAIGTSDAIYKSEGEYYLSHSYEKVPYEPGEIYLDDRTGSSLSDSGVLLNGHAVPNGTKFGNFKKLLKVKKQPKVLIWDDKEQEVSTYKMLFVSLIDGNNSGIIMNFNNESERLNYYKGLYTTSIQQWAKPKKGDRFLLLNSCSYIIDNGHYVVVAKKVD